MLRTLLISSLALLVFACDGDETPPRATTPDAASPTARPSATPSTDPVVPLGIPSGALVLYAAGNRRADVMRVNADGSGLAFLTDESASGWVGTWSPDGSAIAYTRSSGGFSQLDIFLAAAGGSETRNVTSTPDQSEVFVSWSPDGTKILFGAFTEASGIWWVMDRDGANQNLVVPLCRSCFSPQWLPDSRSLVAGLQVMGQSEYFAGSRIVLIDTEGAVIRDVVVVSPQVSEPRVSPDGEHIAYVQNETLQVMEIASGETAEMWRGSISQDIAWSPDGTRIALSARSTVPAAPGMPSPPIDEQDLILLTLVSGAMEIVASEPALYGIAWSPNGSRIAYAGGARDDREVYVIGVGGGTPVNVSRDPLADYDPSWSPDGKSLIFASSRRTRDGIYWYDPSTGKIELVTNRPPVGENERVIWPGGAGACVTPQREPQPNEECLSPDGTRSAEAGDCLPNVEQERRPCLRVAEVASGAVLALTLDDLNVESSPPAWSPDGTQVAFLARIGAQTFLYRLVVASRELVRVARADALTNPTQSIVWSRDGKEIFFTRGGACGGGGCVPGSLYKIRADGSDEEQISDFRVQTLYGFAP